TRPAAKYATASRCRWARRSGWRDDWSRAGESWRTSRGARSGPTTARWSPKRKPASWWSIPTPSRPAIPPEVPPRRGPGGGSGSGLVRRRRLEHPDVVDAGARAQGLAVLLVFVAVPEGIDVLHRR